MELEFALSWDHPSLTLRVLALSWVKDLEREKQTRLRAVPDADASEGPR